MPPQPANMRITVLGSGTSSGVPVIACDCEVCRSSDPHNRRLRSSALVEVDAIKILIDTGPDLRQQCLENDIRRIDAVLYTHEHADHIFGCDDLRILNFVQGQEIPAFGHSRTISHLRKVYSYFTNPFQNGGGIPKVAFHEVSEAFTFHGILIEPIPVWHGKLEIYGYRIGPFAYVNDCSGIPDRSLERLKGLKVLILDALRYRSHPTHFNLEEAVQTAQMLGAERTFFTHMTHDVDHRKANADLPEGMELAFDRLQIDIDCAW
ncbi:MAG TPA: MBL fold metallo-hydrolase [bacterium]|nr:MBL fold metallo-hydrolase [bacterium]